MKSNLSEADKIIRLSIGLLCVLAGIFLSQIWLIIIGAYMLLTALINFDPLYLLIGFKSRKFHESPFHSKKKKKNHH